MSRDIWFTSDQHWCHANILKFTMPDGSLVRPEFSSVEEMDEVMIERWNSVVKPGDIVWHGGDITMNAQKFRNEILPRLNGRKRITVGNHDPIMELVHMRAFQKMVTIRRFDEYGFVLSHIPLQIDSMWNWRQQKTMLGIHGHIHRHDAPPGPYLNI
ncbi:MAG: hypothetical protein WCY93_12045, partial [Anaerolineaceae bacterium]